MDDPFNEFIIYPLFQCKYSKIFRNCSCDYYTECLRFLKKSFNVFYGEYENVDEFFVFAILFRETKTSSFLSGISHKFVHTT